jgi:hypothetical protein
MQTFKFTVDTKPMAEEIKSVSRHVNGTTGAVVAMQTAVVIAEERAAEHVCNNVNKGFYSLIRSQISQKMAKLQSDVDSHLMQLVQQKNALLGNDQLCPCIPMGSCTNAKRGWLTDQCAFTERGTPPSVGWRAWGG